MGQMRSLNETSIGNRLALAVIKAKSVYMNIGYISCIINLWWDVMRKSVQTGCSFSRNLSSQAVLPPTRNRVMRDSSSLLALFSAHMLKFLSTGDVSVSV